MALFCEGRREAQRAGAPMPHLRRNPALDDKSVWRCDESCQDTIEQVSMYSFSGGGQYMSDWNAFLQHTMMMTMTIATQLR